MHQTTVRFGPDLWGDIEVEAGRAGVSVAQYVRDSAMMRVAYVRGREGDPHYDAALEKAAGRSTPPQPARSPATDVRENAAALRAETQQARRQARVIREEARRRRAGADEAADRAEQQPRPQA